MPVVPDVTIIGTVTHYPSRTARVLSIFIVAPASANYLLWSVLSEAAGVEKEDHQVFTITNNTGTLHVMFTDGYMRIGTEILVGDW